MDSIRDPLPENCIILVPEELSQLETEPDGYDPLSTDLDNASSFEQANSEASNNKLDQMKADENAEVFKPGTKSKKNKADVLQNILQVPFQLETLNNESIESEEINILKKRGRPKKNSLGVKTIILDTSVPDNEQMNNSVVNSEGNLDHSPSTSNVASNLNALNSSVTNIFDTGVKKRGRGRPKKVLGNDTSFSKDSDFEIPSNTTTKKRKRGKPQILDSDTSIDSDNSSSSADFRPIRKSKNDDELENVGNNSQNCEVNKVPKKRGRPKKNSLDADETLIMNYDPSPVDNSDIIPLKRRNRKEVNYLLLENPDMFEQESETGSSKSRNKNLTTEYSVSKKRGRSNNISLEENVERRSEDSYLSADVIKIESHGVQYEATAGTSSINTKNENYGAIENSSVPESPENVVRAKSKARRIRVNDSNSKTKSHGIQYKETTGTSSNNTENENNGAIENSSMPESPENVVSAKYKARQIIVNDSNSETTRYKWTGNATKAINQMFSMLEDKSIDDVSHDHLQGKTRRKGRPRLGTDRQLDKNGTSVCMVCHKTIPNLEWDDHKRTVHYNLSWRKGDMCLDITNPDFVLKTLTQLTQTQGYIECSRCSEKIKKPKKFVAHLEMCNGVVSSSGCVTCAVCKLSMEKSTWQYHNYRKHNNLAWRDGDPPLNLEDRDLVLRILNGLYKAKKPLHCEKCDEQKKSVMGYLSHKTTCMKSGLELENLKVACHLCGKRVLPISMDYHLKMHEKQNQVVDYASYSTDYFVVDSEIIEKRRAATEALKIIDSVKGQANEESKYYVSQCDFQESFVQDILRKRLAEQLPLQCIFADCDFSADSEKTMAEHMNCCDKKPVQYFICKMCLFWCELESDMHDHFSHKHNRSLRGSLDKEFQSEHLNQCGSEDDELLDNEAREKRLLRLKGKQKMSTHSNVRIKPIFLIHPMKETPSALLYRQAYAWMLEFCGTNYSTFNLYQYLRNDQPYQVLDCDLLNEYLPKTYQSCDIAAQLITARDNPDTIIDVDFRKLELFQVWDFYDGDVTIFCGGPITAIAWLPTPYDQKTHNQVLAVSVLNNMDKRFSVDKNYHEACVVQFWDFGIMDCHQKYIAKPYLLFGMALTCGPIWHLEWCPSGCLDCFEEDSTCRLGLLAVASSDSFVYIYSIDNLPDISDRGVIYKGEAVLKLQLEMETSGLEGRCYYATKISWSKAAGHRYIAVGYSNGLIALFDLQNESSLLLRGDQTGTNIIFPYKTFQGHTSSITGLTLSHLAGGNKFLFSTSFDRTAVFWDLTTLTRITSHRRNTTADGVWLTQWPTSLVVDDESCYNDKALAHSYYKAIRYLMSPEGTNFTFSASGINALSFSDWLNTILHGSNAGEVMAQFTHRMFFGMDNKMFKSSYVKCLFSVAKLIRKSELENINCRLATTYDEAVEKYGVAFLDYNSEAVSNLPNTNSTEGLKINHVSKFDISEYGLQSIKKIAWNPNPQACSFYAVGYESGFVRLQGLQFLSNQLPL